MARKLYVYSTLTASVRYCAGQFGEGGSIVPSDGILIEGGANVADKRLITPEGAIITEIDADQLDALRQDATFALHEKNGFIKISEHRQGGEAAASDMVTRDASAPLVDADFKEGEAPKAATSAPVAPAKANPRKA